MERLAGVEPVIMSLEGSGPTIGRQPQIWCRMLGLNQPPLCCVQLRYVRQFIIRCQSYSFRLVIH